MSDISEDLIGRRAEYYKGHLHPCEIVAVWVEGAEMHILIRILSSGNLIAVHPGELQQVEEP